MKYRVPVRVTLLAFIELEADSEEEAQYKADIVLENTPDDVVVSGALHSGQFEFAEVADTDEIEEFSGTAHPMAV